MQYLKWKIIQKNNVVAQIIVSIIKVVNAQYFNKKNFPNSKQIHFNLKKNQNKKS